jgi:serine/threonine protein kinase
VVAAAAAVTVAATEISSGASLGEGGRYRLERLLGTGGMASVWLAQDERLEREVAVKVLADVLALDPSYVSRFEREARLAAGLSHPHLVSIYDYSANGPRPYLVLEYVGGGTLADRLRGRRRPDWDTGVLAEELLDAVGYIHRAGIIHRDIKPANVLIGFDGRARLTDFGIAQPTDATRLTNTGHVIGTRRYLAPELMSGDPATARSDLYACGVLLEECTRPDTPPGVQTLVTALTQEQPSRRPASAEAALELLHAPGGSPQGRTRSARAPTAPTAIAASTAPTQVLARARQIPPRLLAMLAAGVVLILALILLTTGGGGPGLPRITRLSTPPAQAPLSQQLTQLDRSIDQARR